MTGAAGERRAPVLVDGETPPPASWETGAKRLVVALLDDAVLCATGRGYAPDPRARRRAQAEALAWILSDAEGDGVTFAFVAVCRVLGLDPQAVRAAVTARPC